MAPRRKLYEMEGHKAQAAGGDTRKNIVGETDPIILARRQKQIDYGKITMGYRNYLSIVPKEQRSLRQPRTPDKYQICSRRSWDGQIKIWRLLLHAYDNWSAETSITDQSTSSEDTQTDYNGNFLTAEM